MDTVALRFAKGGVTVLWILAWEDGIAVISAQKILIVIGRRSGYRPRRQTQLTNDSCPSHTTCRYPRFGGIDFTLEHLLLRIYLPLISFHNDSAEISSRSWPAPAYPLRHCTHILHLAISDSAPRIIGKGYNYEKKSQYRDTSCTVSPAPQIPPIASD